MKRFTMVVALLVSAQLAAAQAQTSESGGGMTPSFSPVTWDCLLYTSDAADE